MNIIPILKEHGDLLDEIRNSKTILDTLESIVYELVKAYDNGNKVLLIGNGGSAADSQHMAGELMCRLCIDREGLPAIALTTDSSVTSAISNDYDFSKVFSRQIKALCYPGDVLIAFSTSGTSPNIIEAIKQGRESNAVVIGFTGKGVNDMNLFC